MRNFFSFPLHKHWIIRFKLFVKLFRVIAVCATILCISGYSVYASDDSTMTKSYISFIGNLNSDCVLDTVMSQYINEKYLLPQFIIWGKGDSLKCGMYHADSIRFAKTEFVYPDWNKLRGSFSTLFLNNDTLPDLIISLATPDTSFQIAIFGQNSLDLIDTINLSEITNNQTAPFYATFLSLGNGLKNPGFRTYSNSVSYEMDVLQINPNQTIPQNPKSAAEIVPSDIDFQIYPNPVSDILKFKINGGSSGIYSIEIYSLLSNMLIANNFVIGNQLDYQGTINTASLPAGNYLVRLEKDNMIVAVKNIVILN